MFHLLCLKRIKSRQIKGSYDYIQENISKSKRKQELKRKIKANSKLKNPTEKFAGFAKITVKLNQSGGKDGEKYRKYV